MKKMIKTLYFGDGKTPSANGRIYPPEVIDGIINQINDKEVPVVNPPPDDARVNFSDVIGNVKNAKKTEYGIECEIEVYRNEDLQERGFFCPVGVGYCSTGSVTLNYELRSFSVSSTPAFYNILNLDDLDFEEIMSYIKGPSYIKNGIIEWACSRRHHIGQKQIDEIFDIIRELIDED